MLPKLSSNINLKELDISIPLSDKSKYFKLIETFQKSLEQDTYLLMDNLYEEHTSCIDTYSLFLYLKQNNYKAKYVLYEKNPLYKKLKENNELEDIIVCSESSLTGHDLYEKLFFVLIKTKFIILSFPHSLYSDIRKFAYNNQFIQLVGIGHGPVFFKTSILNKKLSSYISPNDWNLYLVSSQIEKKIFLQYGWPESKLLNIGLPRFDWLKREQHKTKNIFIMFTWRLDFRDSITLKKSKYYRNLQSLLNNSELQKIAKTKGYNVTVAFHHSLSDLCGTEMHIPSCYELADTNSLINYINNTDLFITDYSSIVHDFMFLNIPVIFYRLDYGDNLLGKLDKFDMEEIKAKDNQIFNVCYEEREVIDKIVQYRDNNFILEDDNLEIENSFFSEKKNLCEKFTKALENYKVFEVDDTSIEPKWKDVKNALCVSCSNEYLPYLSVYLKSVVENSHQNKDIIVFERDISNENKKRIINYFTNSNTSIRFVNPTSLFKNVNLYVSHDYFKEECYYRCAAPKLLNKYDKIIFTDLDLIVMDDIFKLADIDIKGHPIAACIEPIWQELYMQNNKIYNREIRAYTNNVLKLSSPFQYYNTGVLIFDVKEYNKLNSFEKLLDIINNNKLLYQEQCAFNILFKDNFFTLPNVWNYELAPSLVNNTYHFEFYTKYKEVENEAKILHYLGRYKPWKNPFEYKASIWWSYARQTPFYEEILSNMINHNNASVTARLNASISQLRKELTQLHFPNINKHFAANESTIARANANISQLRKEFTQLHFPNINNHFAANEREMKLLFVMNHLFSFKLKKYYYGFNKAFSFGKRHQRYQQKFDLVKNLIKDAKLYKRSFFKV